MNLKDEIQEIKMLAWGGGYASGRFHESGGVNGNKKSYKGVADRKKKIVNQKVDELIKFLERW